VVGRDPLIQQLWQTLERQSVLLTSERRIGKSTVVRKMYKEVPEDGFRCFYRDLEGLSAPEEFVERVYLDVKDVLDRADRAKLQFHRLLAELGGAEIWKLKLPHLQQRWKDLLATLMADLCRAEGRMVVFFWDELPLFIHDVKLKSGERAAMEVLDVLRSLRHHHERLRMVFTGSVGLHLVLKDLRKKRYANAPTNDLRTVEVPPLEPEEGARLARLLVEGEGLSCVEDRDSVAGRISEAAGHIPFYIHWLVARLAVANAPVSGEAVDAQLQSLISDSDDPADFGYYRRRLDTYYDRGETVLALAALDAVAAHQGPLGFEGLLNLVRHRQQSAQLEALRDVLQLLERDHYLMRGSSDGRYGFRHSPVQRWWRFARA